MSSNQNFTSYTPFNMVNLGDLNFNGAASTGMPGDDATVPLGYPQPEWPFDGIIHPQYYQETCNVYNPGQLTYDANGYGNWRGEPYHQLPEQHNVDPARYHDSVIVPSYLRPYSQLPGDNLIPVPSWPELYRADLSPSHRNNLLPPSTIQQLAPNTYEPSYPPAPDGGDYYHASITLSNECLHPDLPPGGGTISGMSDAVVGTAADAEVPTPSKHMHRRGGKKGGKKGGQKRELDEDKVHDCAYNGKEAPLERDNTGYARPSAIYQQLCKLKTEALDSVILRSGEAHGVGLDGEYVCHARASILRGLWRVDEGVCMKVLQDKDGYRRHLEEQHLGLHGRRVNKEYVPIGTRIRRALEEIKKSEILKAGKEGRPTKKRRGALKRRIS